MFFKPKNKPVVWLPIKLRQTGGTSTFARKFQAGMAARGWQISFERPTHFDLLLASPGCPLPWLIAAKIAKIPIIQRLDGAYYPQSVAGRWYRLYNLPLKMVFHMADGFIYQSQYSQRLCDRFLGKNKYRPQVIVYNGVDLERFTPEGHKKTLLGEDSPVFVTVSRFRRRDQIEPLIAGFLKYNEKYSERGRLFIIGDFVGAAQAMRDKYTTDDRIVFVGPINNQELPAYLRAADVFLFTHLNPPCPNNVVEAMACGLPICGVADGSMPELVQDRVTGRLLPTAGDAYDRPRKISPDKFADNLNQIMTERTAYSNNARERAIKNFDIQSMLKRYDEFMRQII